VNPVPEDPVTGGELMLFVLGGVMTLATLAIAIGVGIAIRREERAAAAAREREGEKS